MSRKRSFTMQAMEPYNTPPKSKKFRALDSNSSSHDDADKENSLKGHQNRESRTTDTRLSRSLKIQAMEPWNHGTMVDIKEVVKTCYDELQDRKKFKAFQSISSTHNQEVKEHLMEICASTTNQVALREVTNLYEKEVYRSRKWTILTDDDSESERYVASRYKQFKD